MNCPHCGAEPRMDREFVNPELRGFYSWECGSWQSHDTTVQSENCKAQAKQLSEFRLFQASIRAIDED